MTLTNKIFGIQKEIVNILPFGWSPVDSGMFLNQQDVIWRDMTCESTDGKEFIISYSTDGELKHEDVPTHILQRILEVLSGYKK